MLGSGGRGRRRLVFGPLSPFVVLMAGMEVGRFFKNFSFLDDYCVWRVCYIF